jgi:hypothetical protein
MKRNKVFCLVNNYKSVMRSTTTFLLKLIYPPTKYIVLQKEKNEIDPITALLLLDY